jgi:hypothetical protein
MMTQTDPLRPRSTDPGGHDPGGHDPQERHRDTRDRGAEVAQDAKDEARSVADTAQHEAGRVADEVRHQATHLTESAREQLHQQARSQTEHLGEAIGGMGDRIQALADGRPEDAGNVQDLARSIAEQAKTVSRRIDELGFDGSLDELQRYARRRPGAFLAGAAALGFVAARLTQGARQAGDDRSDPRSTSMGHAEFGQPQIRDRGADVPPPLPAEGAGQPLRDGDPIVLPEPTGERIRR